jgi:hypothetical protein
MRHMKRKRLAPAVVGALGASLLLAGCGGIHRPQAASTTSTTSTTSSAAEIAGTNLLPLIIQAPEGFSPDQTSGATGAVSPQVFTAYGGAAAAAQDGFVAGYKENYVDQVDPDGVAVTLFKFATAVDAAAYFSSTASKTLSFSHPTITPFNLIPGAVSVVGTKAYAGDWQSAIVFATEQYYVSVVWVQTGPGPPPVQLRTWSKAQWLLLNGHQ